MKKLSFGALRRLFIDSLESKAIAVKKLNHLSTYIKDLEYDYVMTSTILDGVQLKKHIDEFKNYQKSLVN